MKKFISLLAVTTMVAGMAVGCGNSASSDSSDAASTKDSAEASADWDSSSDITIVSREDGSGTRGAFTELLGIAVDDVDNTIDTAEITNSTAVMLTTVSGNTNAIGYVSLGSLSSDVKAVKVDGVEPSVEDIKNGSYAVSRPFNIVTKAEVSDLAKDFITYIESSDGQAVIEDEGYISSNENAQPYTATNLNGTITIAGSTSVAPVMEVLADDYMKLNGGVTIEIQQTGSSAGITSTIEGVCDIGMASRELKDSETSQGVSSQVIAIDGIAIIVNNNNTVDTLSAEQIKDIYTGAITTWSEVK